MHIELSQIGRKFGYQNVFSGVDLVFEEGDTAAILGGNGSGKSTLIKIIYGALLPTSGKIFRKSNGADINAEQSPFKISLASPYFELIEELGAEEFLFFYTKFKPVLPQFSPQDVLEIAYLHETKGKEIRHFSSGMKQRFRLALAMLSDVKVILLDEPVSNLDPRGVEWYRSLIRDYRGDRTIIVGSNFNEEEISFCEKKIFIENYKNEKV